MIPPPPPLDSLLAGYKLHVGLGHAEVLATWDVETYSEAGFIWDEARNRWVGPPGASQGKKGLPVVGAAVYSEHPTCEVLSMSYDLKDGRGIRRWKPGEPLPADFIAYVDAGGLLEAHNAAFEGWINRNVMVSKYGFPLIPRAQMRCSMAKARAAGLPGGLDPLGEVLQLPLKKDKDGKRLLDKFSVPRNPTKPDPRRRIRPCDDPIDGPKLYAYNDRDIVAEASASARIPDLPPTELAYWLADQEINARGVAIDVESVNACIAIVEQAHERYNAELLALTGGTVARASELQKLSGWLGAQGVHMGSLDEESTTMALARDDLPAHARRALQIREAVGSASVKKVFAMRNQATRAGRLHDLYSFHAAHTGRPTGNGPQPTNLPNSGPKVALCGACKRFHGAKLAVCPWCAMPAPPGREPRKWNPSAVEDAITIIRTRSLELLEMYFGDDPMYVVSGCLRGLFVAGPGKEMISSDYSSIEAVGAAAIAGEEWRLEVFRTHGKIYEMSASRMFGIPFDDFMTHYGYTREQLQHPTWWTEFDDPKGEHHPLRQLGKIAELAFGFGGWVGSAQAFGMPGDESEIKSNILAWRGASPSIEFLWGGQKAAPALIAFHRAAMAGGGVQLEGPTFDRMRLASAAVKPWDRQPYLYGLEGMFLSAVQNPGTVFPVYRLDGTLSGVSYYMPVGDESVYMLWQGERLITYRNPRVSPARDAWRGLSMSFEGWNTNPKNGPPGWIRKDTWGSRQAENLDQAVCNRIFRHATISLEACGYPVVMHTYDELCSEVPEGFGSVEEYERTMADVPAWAADWPIRAAGGWRGKRYRK